MIKVSVLTPVYNVKRYLRQCLDSLVAQTLDNIEFICIDDGSTDGSSEILDEYAARDSRFRVIHKQNEGYGKTMNLGIRVAGGEYIGIVESDDFADADMFEKLYKTAKGNNAEVVKSNYYIFTDNGGNVFKEMMAGCPYEKSIASKNITKLFQTDTFVWTSIYRKDFLKENKIWFNETPGASYQDVAFSLKVALCCKCMILLKNAYLHYRGDNMDSSVHFTFKKVHCYHDEFAEYWRFLDARSDEEKTYGSAAATNMWRIYKTACWPGVAYDERAKYLKRIIEEFTQLDEKNLLKETQWQHDDWNDLMDLLLNPKKYILKWTGESQKCEFIRSGFLSALKKVSCFYLYGAGEVAKQILTVLNREKLHSNGIIVSSMADNSAFVKGVPVYALDASPADKDKDLVIIAVTPRNPDVQQEIFEKLDDAGYRNIVIFTRELQEAIR